MGIFVSLPGFKPVPPAVEAWSLNYWIVRELPTNIYHISFVCQESGHSLAECFWLRGSQSSHLKFQLRKNLIPGTFMLLLPGFSSSWAVDWGPQFLHACWLEASLSSLPYGPLYRHLGSLRGRERERERRREREGSLISYKGTVLIPRTPPSWPHLNLISPKGPTSKYHYNEG